MNQTTVQTTQQPECYGKIWDQSAVECAGGYDATFVAPNGAKVRPRCDYFDSCKIRTALAKTEAQQRALVAPSSLIRPQQPAAPYAPRFQQPPPMQMTPQAAPPPAYPNPHYPYPIVVSQPVQMMPTNYGIPAYLTVPEERRSGEHFLAPLGREMLRAGGKALGHAFAAWLDHNAFSKKEE